MKQLLILFVFLASQNLFAGLTEVKDFGENPGNLKMFTYTPKNVQKNAPMIVLLHGCSMDASSYDDESGFTNIAEQTGAILLLPEQQKVNNSGRCFNWFLPQDIDRGQGEVESISEMIKHLQKKSKASKTNVFITGLSAGGAMAATMISVYPELFKAAGIVSGMPYGCARTVYDGFACMKSKTRSAKRWASYVRSASNFKGTYPKVIIFQGTHDPYVYQKNAIELKKQWASIHNSPTDFLIDNNPLYLHSGSRNKSGNTQVELVLLSGMGHGQAIDVNSGCGTTRKWIVDHGVCAADMMAKFFKLKR